MSTLAGLAGASGSADGIGNSARFYNPSGVAVDSSDNVYVADTFNQTIRKITPEGIVSTVAGMAGIGGSANGTGSRVRFRSPQGVAVDSAGNLYVADTENNTIRFGQLVSISPPTLGWNFTARGLVLSWPVTASNYVIETSTALSPDAAWTPVSNPVTTLGNSFVLTNTLNAGAHFYRLRAP